ncbi:MAG: DUF5602 domain-containing protein [Verrucomicrobia bacterium]|nr:DUF5602 domain-containing protein [Prolixibacteraceae bacterium]
MRNSIKLMLFFLAIPALAFLESCHMDDEVIFPPGSEMDPSTFFGPSVAVGNGDARAWVSVDKNGDPKAVGINFSEETLEGLPDSLKQFVLPLPADKGKGFYTHALIDWNPEGHEPPGTYDKPHFDFHFYIITNEERMAIGPNDTVKFANAPDSMYVPSAYLHTPGGVPQMGAHWVDLMAPEFTGGVFSKTFVWGSYDGEFIFWEPMITLDYLRTKPNDLISLRQPQAYQQDGWYPTKYKITYSSITDGYTIAITSLQYKEGK